MGGTVSSEINWSMGGVTFGSESEKKKPELFICFSAYDVLNCFATMSSEEERRFIPNKVVIKQFSQQAALKNVKRRSITTLNEAQTQC